MSHSLKMPKKLLVADDSLTIQKVIRLALSNEGYEIQTVSDGNDAIQQISLFRPDVVLIDVALPGQSAFEVKRSINEHDDLTEVRFVLMSSAFEKVDEEQVREVQFHGRLTKPFDPAHLRQVLQDVLAQVTAKRMEPTQFLQRPSAPSSPPTAVSDIPTIKPPVVPTPPPTQASTPPTTTRSSSRETGENLSADLWSENTGSPGAVGSNGDEDIKELTESTIRISGLDDFQWSVQEPKLKPEAPAPLLGGAPAAMDFSTDDFPAPPSMAPPPAFQAPDATLPTPDTFEIEAPLPTFAHDSEAEIERTGIFTPFEPPFLQEQAQTTGHTLPTREELKLPDFSPAPPVNARTDSALSEEKMEELVRREVEAAVRAEIAKLLPEVTERLVKQEIHRLLTET